MSHLSSLATTLHLSGCTCIAIGSHPAEGPSKRFLEDTSLKGRPTAELFLFGCCLVFHKYLVSCLGAARPGGLQSGLS